MLDIDVRDLMARPGTSRTVRMKEPVPGLCMELAEVPEDRRINADLTLESVVEGILASGSLSGVMTLVCARCLQPFDRDFRVRVQELFSPRATAEDDEYPIDEGFLNVEQMLRDAVLLLVPFSPLCSHECLGLCERCGGNRNLGECSCSKEELDPRWAALAALKLPEELPDAGTRR